MLPPTPLSLFCAILLCLPLALIFTFTHSITTSSSSSSSSSLTKTNLFLPPTTPPLKPQINNQTTATATIPPPPQLPLDEEDDVSLFALASRVHPSPKPIKKLAFMFLTTSPLPFAPLWELFFARAPQNLYNIYVHADPSANYTTKGFGFAGVFDGRVIPSKPTAATPLL
ncbi:UNVERIFIED_CONTAM: hypothetical protein Scaly_2821700 [Sesamum calycinum]|uniref:Uncharacterized protein n=1 Tax=Sesamum calycinum TaxID=2727403 RepID=A0AAW2IU65_9LAMI